MCEQTKLTYNYNGLEPVIDALTVETHYAKHHAAYAKNFNDAAVKAGVAEMDVEELLASLDKIEDSALRKALRNNGGGFYNHNLYFDTLAGPAEAAKGIGGCTQGEADGAGAGAVRLRMGVAERECGRRAHGVGEPQPGQSDH